MRTHGVKLAILFCIGLLSAMAAAKAIICPARWRVGALSDGSPAYSLVGRGASVMQIIASPPQLGNLCRISLSVQLSSQSFNASIALYDASVSQKQLVTKAKGYHPMAVAHSSSVPGTSLITFDLCSKGVQPTNTTITVVVTNESNGKLVLNTIRNAGAILFFGARGQRPSVVWEGLSMTITSDPKRLACKRHHSPTKHATRHATRTSTKHHSKASHSWKTRTAKPATTHARITSPTSTHTWPPSKVLNGSTSTLASAHTLPAKQHDELLTIEDSNDDEEELVALADFLDAVSVRPALMGRSEYIFAIHNVNTTRVHESVRWASAARVALLTDHIVSRLHGNAASLKRIDDNDD